MKNQNNNDDSDDDNDDNDDNNNICYHDEFVIKNTVKKITQKKRQCVEDELLKNMVNYNRDVSKFDTILQYRNYIYEEKEIYKIHFEKINNKNDKKNYQQEQEEKEEKREEREREGERKEQQNEQEDHSIILLVIYIFILFLYEKEEKKIDCQEKFEKEKKYREKITIQKIKWN